MIRAHCTTSIELTELVGVASVARPSASYATSFTGLACALCERAHVMGARAGSDFISRFASPVIDFRGIVFKAALLIGQL